MRQLTFGEVEPDGESCPTCGEVFDTQHGVSAHHVQAHGESIAQVAVPCDMCGSDVHVHKSRTEGRHYCDSECKYGHWRNGGHPSGATETRNCANCGEEVTREANQFGKDAFCTHTCYSEWVRDQPNERVEVACDYCGASLPRIPSHASRPGRDFCDLECHGEWLSENVTGTDHPSWRGGNSIYQAVKRLIGDRPWPSAAADTRKAAKECCESCGMTASENGRVLDVHHIVPLLCGGTNAEWNRIALCRSCHASAESYTRAIPEIEPVLTE